MSAFTESLFSTELLDRLPSAVATYDYKTGDVLMLNQRFTEQFGYVLGDMPNIRMWWHQMFIDPETSEEIKDHWDRLQTGEIIVPVEGDPDAAPLEVRGRVRCKDGIDKYVELRIIFMGRIMAATFTDITREISAVKELEKLISTDPETGFRNQKAFTEIFSHQMDRARRYHEPLALILIRINNLADVSEAYGIDCVSRLMGFVSRQILAAVRNCDLAGRTGEAEISVLLPATPMLGVAVVAERIAAKIKSTPFYYDGAEVFVEVQMGVAASDDGIQTAGDLHRMAMEAVEVAGEFAEKRAVQ